MKKLFIIWLAVAGLHGMLQAQVENHPATIREYEQSFPTYPFGDPSPIPLLSPVYPYFRYDGFTSTPVDKKWKVVALENDYIRLLILPEIGGKVWAAIEKSTNRPFLYYNHSVKFRDIAMRGPWTSGGLEANFGIIGHTPACSTPVDYLTRVNEDGSVSCFVGTLDLLTRSCWRVEIRLPRNAALFSTRVFWYNGTPLEQPYYHWMNAGLKAGDDLEFVYPGNRYLGHNGEYASWPVNATNGKQISWYRNNDFGGYKSYHVFGKYADFAGAYWHNDELGMVRYGTHDDKAGKKLWIWGLSRQGMIWEKLLSDTDGQYIELQSGRLFNQNTEKSSFTPFKHRSLEPYETETWKEDWYPVLGTHGFVAASEYGALNLRYDGHRLKIDFCPVQAFTDTLTISAAGRTVYKRPIHAMPLRVFADSIEVAIPADSIAAVLGDQLLTYSASPAAGVLSRPVESPDGFDWTTAYGYYLKGKEAMDMKYYPEAELALDSALQKDKDYLPALVELAGLYYRNMRYAEALKLARHALSIDTEDGGANFIFGLINDRLGDEINARDGFDIASLDPAYRSAAEGELARLYLRDNNLSRAAVSAVKASAAQPLDIDALELQAVIARVQGDTALARVTLERILSLDPLNHFARFERDLADSPQGMRSFTALIRDELPQETYLELGIWYTGCGRVQEAIRVLSLAPPVTEVRLWLAWLQQRGAGSGAVPGGVPDTTVLSPAGAFPFRSETGRLLEDLIRADDRRIRRAGDDWVLRYMLALIYKDRNRVKEARDLLASCGEPAFAPLYAVRAALAPTADSASALHDLQRACTLDNQWRYKKLLAEFYIGHSDTIDAERIAGDYYRAHPADYVMGMLYAKILLFNRKYAESDKVLTSLTIIPFEGATAGRELYREDKLMQALELMKRRRYAKALEFIAAAKRWPESLGVGEPYKEDEDLRWENWMSAYCEAAMKKAPAVPVPMQLRNSPGAGTGARILMAVVEGGWG
jgi:tetratricopeptide (TPR) repeat protein